MTCFDRTLRRRCWRRWRRKARSRCVGPPGNAVSSPVGPHIQTHQPSMGRRRWRRWPPPTRRTISSTGASHPRTVDSRLLWSSFLVPPAWKPGSLEKPGEATVIYIASPFLTPTCLPRPVPPVCPTTPQAGNVPRSAGRRYAPLDAALARISRRTNPLLTPPLPGTPAWMPLGAPKPRHLNTPPYHTQVRPPGRTHLCVYPGTSTPLHTTRRFDRLHASSEPDRTLASKRSSALAAHS